MSRALWLLLSVPLWLPAQLHVAEQWRVRGPVEELNAVDGEDFAPVWDAQRGVLYFSSTRKGGRSQLYQSRWESGRWSAPEPVRGLEYAGHRSYACPSPDGWLYFCQYFPGRRQAFMGIARVRQHGSAWGAPERVEIQGLPEEAFVGHPSIAPDGKSMVFASDCPGGKGGLDLWICAWDSAAARWVLERNLWELNSEGNEITPFLAAPDTLYFASDGHGGRGGYELFVSIRHEGRWSEPEPLQWLNTEADESDFAPLPFEGRALFVRRSNGRLKLYEAYRTAKDASREVR